jgi:hypothetical protein
MEQSPSDIIKTSYVFQSFVSGPNNRLAFAAALKVTEEPGRAYNPLIIYGGVGLGKTHLLHAVGNASALAHPDFRIEMLNGSQLQVSDLTKAEKADLLLFDDLHMGLNSREIQVRLLPLFDRMIGSGRQIVITTDMHPQKIEMLDPKLLSRLLGGVFVALKEIDVKEKMLILSKKAEAKGQKMTEDIQLLIASRVSSNVRELEGALNRVLLYSSLMEGPITKEMVDEALPAAVAAQEPEPAAAETAEVPAAEEASGEFGDFISGLDNKVQNLISEQQDGEKTRREYKEKIYIWKMKGFNTSEIERLQEQDISVLAAGYEDYTLRVEKLIDLQQRFGLSAAKATAEEVARIESMLFDPEEVLKLEELVIAMEDRLAGAGATADIPVSRAVPVSTEPVPIIRPVPAPKEEQPAPALAAAPPIQPVAGTGAATDDRKAPPAALVAAGETDRKEQPDKPVYNMPSQAGDSPGLIERNWTWIEDRLMEDY